MNLTPPRWVSISSRSSSFVHVRLEIMVLCGFFRGFFGETHILNPHVNRYVHRANRPLKCTRWYQLQPVASVILEAVAYTQLDVYKRQLQGGVMIHERFQECPASGAGRECCLPSDRRCCTPPFAAFPSSCARALPVLSLIHI